MYLYACAPSRCSSLANSLLKCLLQLYFELHLCCVYSEVSPIYVEHPCCFGLIAASEESHNLKPYMCAQGRTHLEASHSSLPLAAIHCITAFHFQFHNLLLNSHVTMPSSLL